MDESRQTESAITLSCFSSRVGDHAKNIGEDALFTAEAEDIPPPEHLLEVA
jgi:phosphate uptake regulator